MLFRQPVDKALISMTKYDNLVIIWESRREIPKALPIFPKDTELLVMSNKAKVILVDVDGTCRKKPTGLVDATDPLPAEVADRLDRLKVAGTHVGAVTGRSRGELKTVERRTGFRFDRAYCEFGAHHTWSQPGGGVTQALLVPRVELLALTRMSVPLEVLMRQFRAQATVSRAVRTFTVLDAHDEAVEAVRGLLTRHSQLGRYLSLFHNEEDGGINIVPLTVAEEGKGLATSDIKAKGFDIAVGAGDSLADLPLLRAARFPVATSSTGRDHHPALVAHIRERGVGFVTTKPHGFGLLQALDRASSMGIL